MQRNIFQSLRRMCRACICDRSLYHAAIMRFATPGVFLHHGFAIILSSLACSDPSVKALPDPFFFFSLSFFLFRPTLSLVLGLYTIYKYIVSSVLIGLCTLGVRKSWRKAKHGKTRQISLLNLLFLYRNILQIQKYKKAKEKKYIAIKISSLYLPVKISRYK